MMRLYGTLACSMVTVDCLEKATGVTPQQLFSPDAIGAWFLPAIFWAVIAFRFAVLPTTEER